MSYDIYIGDAERTEVELCDGEYSALYDGVMVKGQSQPDAPRFPFDEMSAGVNSRHPGYSQWAGFCDATRLREMFFGPTIGLMRRHPGTFALEAHHLTKVRAARIRWAEAHPGAIPGFDWDPMMSQEKDDGVRGRDGILARLLWLEWWIDWALTNSVAPAIHNH